MIPYATASSALNQKSRVASFSTTSAGFPQKSPKSSNKILLTFSHSTKLILASWMLPPAPPDVWCNIVLENLSDERLPLVPAPSNTEPIDAAIPVLIVAISDLMYCITSTIDNPDFTEPPGLSICIVIGSVSTESKYINWACVGGAINHPDKGKRFDLSPDTNQTCGIEDASVFLYPSDGYGEPNLLRTLIKLESPDAIMMITDPRYFTWLFQIENEIRKNIPINSDLPLVILSI